jgi:hypothetical protein
VLNRYLIKSCIDVWFFSCPVDIGSIESDRHTVSSSRCSVASQASCDDADLL